MSQDSIGVVTTGTMKATGMEDNSETKPLPQIERHSYSEVGWISRQILSASGRGRTFFLTSLFIELIVLMGKGSECNVLIYIRGCQEHFSPSAGGAGLVRGLQPLSP